MPYIAFDLLALEQCPNIARLARCSEDAIIAGFTRLWAHCWRQSTDRVTRFHLMGLFGEDVADALVSFEFLEVTDTDYRVRGADRYLRLKSAQSKGGHKAKGNLIPGGKKRRGRKSSATPENSSAPAEEQPRSSREPLRLEPSDSSALTSSIEHRASNKTLTAERPAGGEAANAKTPDPRHSPLVNRLYESFGELKGHAYKVSGHDLKAVQRLLAHAEPDEIDRRWRIGLEWALHKKRCHSIAELELHWNVYADVQPSFGFLRPAANQDQGGKCEEI